MTLVVIFSVILFLALAWCGSVLVAWVINRPELKATFGSVPFNWRIFGYIWLYPQYLKKINNIDE